MAPSFNKKRLPKIIKEPELIAPDGTLGVKIYEYLNSAKN